MARVTRFLQYVDHEIGEQHCAIRFSPRDLSDVVAAVIYTIKSVIRHDVVPDFYVEWLTWANTKRAYGNPAARLIRAVWELMERAAGSKSSTDCPSSAA